MLSRSIRVLLTFFAILAGSESLAAQPKAPKLPTIADLDRAMGAERYADARQIANVLLQTGGTAGQAVSLSYGRILLGQNDKKAFTEYRKNVRQLKLKGPDATLVEVYDAWALALARAAETDAAVKTLEDILGKNENCDATAEAADVLAQLYLARGDTADAKRVVEAGLKQFTGYQPRKTGYIDQILKNRLKAKASPAQALYDAAEKLRHEKKFLEAGRVYTQVQTTYPKDALAQAAEFHIGECLIGLQRPVQALELWRKFLKESPAGAWRGQARVAVADLLLDQLDLAGAADEIRQAAAVLDNLRGAGSGEQEADSSWPEAAADIRLRQGIIALLNGQYEPAAAALNSALNSPRPAGEGQANGSPRPYPGEGQALGSPRLSGEGQGVRAVASPRDPGDANGVRGSDSPRLLGRGAGGEGRREPPPSLRRQEAPARSGRRGPDGSRRRPCPGAGPSRRAYGKAGPSGHALHIGPIGPDQGHHYPDFLRRLGRGAGLGGEGRLAARQGRLPAEPEIERAGRISRRDPPRVGALDRASGRRSRWSPAFRRRGSWSPGYSRSGWQGRRGWQSSA